MAHQLSFDDLFTNFLLKLNFSGKVVEISSYFGPDKDIREMFDFVWNMDSFHQYLSIVQLNREKNDKTSEAFRLQGNVFYLKRDLMSALEYYNKSICHAPNCSYVSSKKETENKNLISSEKESNNLAFAYANRSAVLFELQHYKNSLLDIQRAYTCGYPSLKKFKLIEREAKCLQAVNEMENAKAVLQNGISIAKNLNLKEEKISNICKPLEDLLDEYKTTKENLKESLENPKIKLIFDIPECPQIESKNPEIPSLSSAVSMSYAPDKGRYIIANRDIMPGEILVSEKCFSCILLPSYLSFHCSYCLRKTYIPLPCPNCSLVVFCSEECLTKGLESFHSIECPVLSSLIALDCGKNPKLAFRMIIQTPLKELKSKVSCYLKEKSNDPQHLGYNEENIYSSQDYRTIFHLVTNKDKRSVSDLFKRVVKAACLVKILLKTNYFGRPFLHLDEIETKIKEDISFVGFVLSTHLMNLPCNAHSIAALAVNVKSYQDSVMQEIGAGTYGALSLINHSCNPTIARSCYGSAVMAYAIIFVPKGAEIFDCYGEHYSMNTKLERHKEIKLQYYFDCNCDACSGNWSLYSKLKSETLVKCLECTSPVPFEEKACPKCKISTLEMKAPTRTSGDISEPLFHNISKSISLFNSAYKNILKGDITKESIERLLELIFYLSKYAILPNKLLFEVQETLKHCYDRKALHYDA
ncbi:UNVERIFIED_CONTAM: hypothetical protein RMT77_000968 [Armadillidium vulgare]